MKSAKPSLVKAFARVGVILSIVAAAPMAAHAAVKWNHIGRCSKDVVLKSMSVSETTGKHHYSFQGKCHRWGVDQNGARHDWIGAEMGFSFDPGTGVLIEQVIPDGGNALLKLTYNCGVDPGGLKIGICSHTGTSAMGPYQPWFSDEGHASAAKHYPLPSIGGPIRDYIAQKIPDPPPPKVKKPEPGRQYARTEGGTEDVIVSLEKAEPTIWYKLAKAYKVGSISMPEEAENRFLVEVDRWMPKDGGGGKWHRYLEKYQAPDHLERASSG